MTGVSPLGNIIDLFMVKDKRVPSGSSTSDSDDQECEDDLLSLPLLSMLNVCSSTSSAGAWVPEGSCNLTDVSLPNAVVSQVEPILGVLPSPPVGSGVTFPLVLALGFAV